IKRTVLTTIIILFGEFCFRSGSKIIMKEQLQLPVLQQIIIKLQDNFSCFPVKSGCYFIAAKRGLAC
ncbi:MAG TPA: hypothetical protein PKI37_04830, partial [Candidatus Cloacimonas sp.]|nr:hypothetical protein [Candidatus Cloacimonas sp.]